MPASSASSSSESGSASSSRASSPKATPDTTHSSRKNRPGADGARNEGINPHWAFKPPAGTVALDHDEDFAEYDWDAVNDEDVELWLVRAPADVKPKHLENIQLDAPTSSRAARIGAVSRKNTTYDVWSVGLDGAGEDKHASVALSAGVEEMRGIGSMLPRKRKGGKLFLAPKPFARHIIVSAQPTKPTPLSETGEGPVEHYQNPPRHSYPDAVLKHKFAPYGSATAGNAAISAVAPQPTKDADVVVDAKEEQAHAQDVTTSPREKKTKKRKGEKEVVEAKKTKKAKVAT